MTRNVIINADDFGASAGINRGIVEAHTRGVVTSTSLMVSGRAVEEAVTLSRECPRLGIGLHWDVTGEDEREFDLTDTQAVRDELNRQLDRFEQLMNRPPTHVDSHRHVHRAAGVMEVFRDVLGPLGLPVRHDGRVHYVGGFYGQWEHGVTDLSHLSVEYLLKLLRDETADGWTEIACHPGYVGDGFRSVYLTEREHELRTLTDPRVRDGMRRLSLRPATFADFAATIGGPH